ncbi:MAG: hypothetical protein KDA88_07010 [Planctomycetaceae bacterium]|nr:hypothetical protein [Planctomycetaceae bacterium]MCB9950526.1 hypothetical protein [Planctomycetaceae bacterium]
MKHFTCDMCGGNIRDERYTVNIEVAAAFDPDELTAEHLEDDHLAMIADEIDLLDSTAEFEVPDTGAKHMQFDLCSRCCRSYTKAPLIRYTTGRPSFSSN